jgi:hypothetical protein
MRGMRMQRANSRPSVEPRFTSKTTLSTLFAASVVPSLGLCRNIMERDYRDLDVLGHFDAGEVGCATLPLPYYTEEPRPVPLKSEQCVYITSLRPSNDASHKSDKLSASHMTSGQCWWCWFRLAAQRGMQPHILRGFLFQPIAPARPPGSPNEWPRGPSRAGDLR